MNDTVGNSVNELLQDLNGEDVSCRIAAVKELALKGGSLAEKQEYEAVVEGLLRAITEANEDLAGSAADALVDIGEPVLSMLRDIQSSHADPFEIVQDTIEAIEAGSEHQAPPEGIIKQPPIAKPHQPSKGARFDDSTSLVWAVQIADSGGSDFDERVYRLNVWDDAIDAGCISYGSVWERLNDPESLRVCSKNWKRSRLDFLRFRPGDIVVATLGTRLLGWGVVKPGAEYEYCPDDLAYLWQEKYVYDLWFRHIFRVDWKHKFGGEGIPCPNSFPRLPAVRRIANSETWAWLRSNGVPVDDNGRVTQIQREQQG